MFLDIAKCLLGGKIALGKLQLPYKIYDHIKQKLSQQSTENGGGGVN